MSKNNPVPLNVGSLFGGAYKFRVPIYQRSYAWGKDEIHTLLDDVRDYQDKKRDYYIGSLVVSGARSPVGPTAPYGQSSQFNPKYTSFLPEDPMMSAQVGDTPRIEYGQPTPLLEQQQAVPIVPAREALVEEIVRGRTGRPGGNMFQNRRRDRLLRG